MEGTMETEAASMLSPTAPLQQIALLGQPQGFQAILLIVCYSYIISGDCCSCLYEPATLRCLVPGLHISHLPEVVTATLTSDFLSTNEKR